MYTYYNNILHFNMILRTIIYISLSTHMYIYIYIYYPDCSSQVSLWIAVYPPGDARNDTFEDAL